MGMGKNLIIFCFCLSFSMWLIAGINTPLTEILVCMQDPNNRLNTTMTSGVCNMSVAGVGLPVSLYTGLVAILALLAVTTGIALALGRFPDPYSYFALVGIFLLAFVTFPVSLMNQTGPWMPDPVKILIGGLFIISYIISFFEFYKGGSL